MRKLILTLSVILLFSGCEGKYYIVSITNDSSKIVSYTYNEYSDTLDISDSKTYEVKAHTKPPSKVLDQYEISSVNFKIDIAGDYTFYDTTPFNLSITNTLPVDVKIKAGNFINDNDSYEIVISANSEKTTAKIYTSKPKFESLIDYPIHIEWSISEDTIYVVVR